MFILTNLFCYVEYCDIFLTHDSSSVRKAHNAGKNHVLNVRNYYAEIGQDKAQAIIDEITKAYENSASGTERMDHEE
ncbi:U1 zinc finger-domain-containing protein [Radiomyces spectabilis]|uniref:U1 zinc finger-domain-containing protein n=1 Tax=Radiomyces spectabilis TaxID=64574 RepID=UPI00221FB0F3|nr:U1 zinc finger-domain-containing protein [Radiomyces spectabilis]KAI8394063.1 U1 zinc finger-domain-containing protein [Radiomyces spectabilis]